MLKHNILLKVPNSFKDNTKQGHLKNQNFELYVYVIKVKTIYGYQRPTKSNLYQARFSYH